MLWFLAIYCLSLLVPVASVLECYLRTVKVSGGRIGFFYAEE